MYEQMSIEDFEKLVKAMLAVGPAVANVSAGGISVSFQGPPPPDYTEVIGKSVRDFAAIMKNGHSLRSVE